MQLGQQPRSGGAGFSPAKGNPQCCSAKKSDFRKREILTEKTIWYEQISLSNVKK